MSFGQCEITSNLLQQIRQIVAEETKEQIHRHQYRNSIVLYGIPVGQEEEKVNSILSCANISVSSYRIVKRLGNPRSTNVRPLRVDLNEGIPVPSMRDLAGKLAASPSLNIFHVRLMETNAQRIKGYQERQARRNKKEATEEKLEEKVEKVDFLREPHLVRAFLLSVAVLILTLPFYPILQSSTFFFTELDIPKNVAQLSSFLLMVLLTFCCVASTMVVDSIPRRVLLLTGGTSCIFSLGVFVLATQLRMQYVAMGAVFGFVLSYGFGVGPVAWFICPELVPLPYRSIMFCSCYAVHSCLVVLTNFATIPLFTAIGGVCFLPNYVIPCLLALMFIYLYLPETKGRETVDILQDLMRKPKLVV